MDVIFCIIPNEHNQYKVVSCVVVKIGRLVMPLHPYSPQGAIE
jgi:hypothetical protein